MVGMPGSVQVDRDSEGTAIDGEVRRAGTGGVPRKFVKLDANYKITDRESGEEVTMWRWVFQEVADPTTVGRDRHADIPALPGPQQRAEAVYRDARAGTDRSGRHRHPDRAGIRRDVRP